MVGAALIWVAIVVVIALGAAGLVAALDHPPGSTGRTDAHRRPATRRSIPQLDAAEADLATLADQVDALGIQARGALAALNGADPAAGEAAISRAIASCRGSIARTGRLRRALAEVPVRRHAGGRADRLGRGRRRGTRRSSRRSMRPTAWTRPGPG